MSEEIRENLNPEEIDAPEMSGEDFAPEKPAKPAKPEKPKKTKAHRMTKEEKQEAREAAKNKSKAQKAWEDSIVANKRVKREEINRKLKKAMLILLIFSLALTSTVYIMLLFIDENNVRITATNTIDKSISLSFDRENWTPYLDVDGPDNMWNISYNPSYHTDVIPKNKAEITALLQNSAEAEPGSEDFIGGNKSKPNVIEFYFYLRNTCEVTVPYTYEMSLEANENGLEDSLRIMWATHVIGVDADKEDRPQTTINCYASLSTDERMAFNEGVEKIAYPAGAERFTSEQFEYYENGKVYNELTGTYDLMDEELRDGAGKYIYADPMAYLEATGFVDTTPFYNDDLVIRDASYLDPAETACIYVCIWIEGSDLDCTDTAIGGYVTLSIKFTAM